MKNKRSLVAAGLFAAVVAFAAQTAVAQAQVPPASYGEGAGVPSRGLPDTGSGPADTTPNWMIPGVAGASVAALVGLGAWRRARRRG
jgi:tetrahydromethanopterin S-methyltransferase subunit C